MGQRVRQFVVGLLVLGVLVGVYWLYTRFGSPRTGATEVAQVLPEPLADAGDGESEIGTIAGVGVRRVQRTRFAHRNEFNEVDREFGFEELLHEEGDQWEITDPYMDLYFPKFRCRVTADRGKVQVETAFGQPMANDALFSGNVVIHILPSELNDPWECFIHLDDVGFVAEKSLFSSAGSVRFLSRSAQLTGRGMELLYDEPHSRLELFRIFDLDTLRLRSSEVGSVTDVAAQPGPAEAALPAAPDTTPGRLDPNGLPTDHYQCIFRENVTIQAPDRIVRARDLLSINNIRWPGSADSNRPAAQGSGVNGRKPIPPARPKAMDTTASLHPAISALPEDLFDIVVTCDGGFSVTPMGTAGESAEPSDVNSPAEPSVAASEPDGAADRQRATAQRIDFDAPTRNTTFVGPVEMAFLIDPNRLVGGEAGGEPMPMTVIAQEAVHFLAATNQIVLEGDPTVVLQKSEPNFNEVYTLRAPRLTLDLVSDANAANELGVGIGGLVADGGPVLLRVERKDGENLLGWTRLKASKLQYSADAEEFTAFGPGDLWMYNAEATKIEGDPNAFSLGQPCYVRLSNFDVLRYSASGSRIIAEDDAQQLVLDYAPLIDGQYGRHAWAVAGHVEASLLETAGGRMELVSLTASKGIEYEDETYDFVGSVLVYDRAENLITVRGDDLLPCYLNGFLVDEIEMDVTTGRVKTGASTPSILQVQP